MPNTPDSSRSTPSYSSMITTTSGSSIWPAPDRASTSSAHTLTTNTVSTSTASSTTGIGTIGYHSPSAYPGNHRW